MVSRDFLKKISSHLLFAYAQQTAATRYNHVTKPAHLKPDRTEKLLLEIHEVLRVSEPERH
jgi:hypothetical protein